MKTGTGTAWQSGTLRQQGRSQYFKSKEAVMKQMKTMTIMVLMLAVCLGTASAQHHSNRKKRR
jgi:hypothetical protein